jgi:cell division septation protein DedD
LTAGAAATPANNATAGSASKPVAAPPKISTAQPSATDAAPSAASGSNSSTAAQSSETGSGLSAPATGSAQASSLMVQIAAVSSHEDADVLVSALHKRGYAVSLSQDEGDGQFHVRVGPFASLSEAKTVRQKLLNDGYNAVVQP